MKTAADFPHIQLPGYVNINELITISDRLHMCETMFGDHNARVMVLLQDGASHETIAPLIKTEGEAGYRHAPERASNSNLRYCLSNYITEHTGTDHPAPRTSGVFYANAVWLLKRGSMSNSVSARAVRASRPVLEATVDGLTQLRVILAFGVHAYEALAEIAPRELTLSAQEARDTLALQEATLFRRKLFVAALPHPSPLSGGKDKERLKAKVNDVLARAELVGAY